MNEQQRTLWGKPENSEQVEVFPRQITLRDYQDKCVAAIEDHLGFTSDSKQRSTVVQLATGLGKTEVFCEIVRANLHKVGRAMVIAHTTELVRQAANKLKARTGIVPAIEQGKSYSPESRDYRAPIVCASVQSLHENRLERFSDIGLLIIDEAHHASWENKSYRQVIEHLRKDNPDLRVLGVTATAQRADKSALGRVFESCAFNYGIDVATKDGWLVPPKVNVCQVTSLDLRSVKTVAGDLQKSAMAAILEQEAPLHEIADVAVKEGAGKYKTLIFCVSVNQAEALSHILNDRYNVPTGWVCGDTRRCTKEERAEILDRFETGSLRCLVNVAVLTEGWDCTGIRDPETGEVVDAGVEHIVMARPTKSLSAYTQMFGRGTRPLPDTVDFDGSTAELRRQAIAESGKPFIRITDLVDNSLKHRLVSVADVLGGTHYPENVVERAKKNLRERKTPEEIEEALELAQKQLEREAKRREKLKVERMKRENVRAEALYERLNVNPFDAYGRQFTDVRQVEPATGSQIRMLRWKKWTSNIPLTKREAGIIIGRIQKGENVRAIQKHFEGKAKERTQVSQPKKKEQVKRDLTVDEINDLLRGM